MGQRINNTPMEEIWKDIPGYEGYYQVSNLGRVRSLDRVIIRKGNHKQTWRGCTLKNKTYSNGYKFVILTTPEYGAKSKLLHRLVAIAFIPNPNGLPQINHKNEDRTDNRVDNLEWCTAKYNINYGNRSAKHRLTQIKRVFQFTLDGTFVAEYDSVTDASRITGIGNIAAACRNKYSRAGGFLWSYTNIPPRYIPLKTTERVVIDKTNGCEYLSLRKAEYHTGVSRFHIASDCRTDKQRFTFKYEEN